MAASDDRTAHPGLRRPRSLCETENLENAKAKMTIARIGVTDDNKGSPVPMAAAVVASVVALSDQRQVVYV
jgi:phosphotransferase system IIB component